MIGVCILNYLTHIEKYLFMCVLRRNLLCTVIKFILLYVLKQQINVVYVLEQQINIVKY